VCSARVPALISKERPEEDGEATRSGIYHPPSSPGSAEYPAEGIFWPGILAYGKRGAFRRRIPRYECLRDGRAGGRNASFNSRSRQRERASELLSCANAPAKQPVRERFREKERERCENWYRALGEQINSLISRKNARERERERDRTAAFRERLIRNESEGCCLRRGN